MTAPHVLLTVEQFSQLATKNHLEKTLDERLQNFATKDDLKNFATKDDLKNFATKDDLKNFATKDDLKSFATKEYLDQKLINFATKDDFKVLEDNVKALDDKLDLRFNQLDYKIETSFDNLNGRLANIEKKFDRHEKDINELNLFTVDHAMRIKKLEFRAY